MINSQVQEEIGFYETQAEEVHFSRGHLVVFFYHQCITFDKLSSNCVCFSLTHNLLISILQLLEVLKKILDNGHDAQTKEITNKHEK